MGIQYLLVGWLDFLGKLETVQKSLAGKLETGYGKLDFGHWKLNGFYKVPIGNDSTTSSKEVGPAVIWVSTTLTLRPMATIIFFFV